MSGRKQIINPSKISKEEKEFLSSSHQPMSMDQQNNISSETKAKYKKVLLSMPESFSEELNAYLAKNPAEGRKSTFVVRVVADYLADKQKGGDIY